jgi:hypothetical protein
MTTTTQPHIEQLRTHLMETLAALKDRANPMEPDRARAVAQVAGVLVDTARVEVEYLKVTNQDVSNFLQPKPVDPALPAPNETPSAHNPFPVSRVHRLEG